MKTYILCIAGTAVLTSVISMLLPGKKTGKIIEGILKLCMVSALILPDPDIFRQNSNIFFNESGISAENTAYINNSYQLAIKNYLQENYRLEASVEYDGGEGIVYLSLKNADEATVQKIKEELALLLPDMEVVVENEYS